MSGATVMQPMSHMLSSRLFCSVMTGVVILTIQAFYQNRALIVSE